MAKDKEKPEEDPFKGVRKADARKKTASNRIRGRMRKIGAPVNEVSPKKEKKKKKGQHRKPDA